MFILQTADTRAFYFGGQRSAAEQEDSFLFTEQHDRVFSLRCRACEREKPYRASDVVEFEGARRAALVRSHGDSSQRGRSSLG